MAKSGIARYSTRTDMRYHKNDRAKNKILVKKWDYCKLPSKESMRQVIWRGHNAFGDNTSFGYYCSGSHNERVLDKILDSYVDKSFDEYYSKMCKMFKGYDRYNFDEFIYWRFRNRYWFRRESTEYSVVDGLIVKN